MHQSVISKIPSWQLKQPDFILDLAKCSKNRTNPITFQEKFQNIKDHHSKDKYIYTDGSKDEDTVGNTATPGSKEYTKRLLRIASIYTTKSTTIDLALA